jgi:hypothetical protein
MQWLIMASLSERSCDWSFFNASCCGSFRGESEELFFQMIPFADVMPDTSKNYPPGYFEP